jgi:hypothetical protein
MVGRVYRASECSEFVDAKKNPAPTLTLTLYSITGDKVIENIRIPVDTGYEGPIMLTSELYRFFMRAELPRTLWRSYRTLSGTVIMRASRAIVKIANMELETFVESPFLGEGKLLIGRELLNKLAIIIDGRRKETCLVEDIH